MRTRSLRDKMKTERREIQGHRIEKLEDRKERRFGASLPMDYRRINSEVSYHALTLNISEDGVMANLPEKLDIGQFLKLRLFFPFGSEISPIEVLSKVIWVEKEHNGDYRSGIRFVDLSPKDMTRLRIFLNKHFLKIRTPFSLPSTPPYPPKAL